jgi:hypothetical protein
VLHGPTTPESHVRTAFDFDGFRHFSIHYADSPLAWYRQIKSTFAVYRVTRSITKFHWAVSKLTASLLDTVGALRDNPAAFADPFAELQKILLRSAASQEGGPLAGPPRPVP